MEATREGSRGVCPVGKELTRTNSGLFWSNHCAFCRGMDCIDSSRLKEIFLFQMSRVPVLEDRCLPPTVGSPATRTQTAPWRRVTLTPCQTLKATKTSSGPRYQGSLAVVVEMEEGLVVK